MSQENVEIVNRFYDAVGQPERWQPLSEDADFPALFAKLLAEFFHPDVEFLPLRAATEGAYRGIDDMERFFADTLEVFEKFEPHYGFLDVDGRVLAWGEIHLRARGSGIETDIPSGGVFEFRDGKIVRWEDFGSKDKALKAVGLEG